MKQLFSVACLLLIAANAFAREIPAEWPEWLREAMMRESTTKTTETFSVADDRVSGVVKGKFTEKPTLNGNFWYFATDIEAASELMCWIFPDGVDSAASTTAIADNLISLNAEASGGVHAKSLYHQSVTNYAGSPVLALEWVYTTAAEENRQIGLVKVRTALVGTSSVICGHTSIGYRQTFEQAFDHLLANLVVQRDQDPYYQSLHSVTINDTPVGFARIWMTEDADGDTEIRTTDAMLMPVDESNVSATDGSSLEFSFPNGELINQYVSSSENGNVVLNVQIGFQEENWIVTGTLQGKAIEVPIDSDVALASTLGQLLQVRELMAAEEAGAIDLTAWLPDVDPTVLSTVEVAITEGAKGTMALGPMVFDAEFDRHGDLQRGAADLGGMVMEITKVWEQGAL